MIQPMAPTVPQLLRPIEKKVLNITSHQYMKNHRKNYFYSFNPLLMSSL